MSEELVKPKKSVWDVIDSFLPSATAVYGRIREQKTGTNPFDNNRPEEDNFAVDDDTRGTGGTWNPLEPPVAKKNNTVLLVIGGIALIGLGIGTYFFIKKNKNV